MTSTARPTGSSYQVTLAGSLGPTFLATCAALGVGHAATSSVFLLLLDDGQGIPDIAQMLQARGLVILDIRRVTAPTVTRPCQAMTHPGRVMTPTEPAGRVTNGEPGVKESDQR